METLGLLSNYVGLKYWHFNRDFGLAFELCRPEILARVSLVSAAFVAAKLPSLSKYCCTPLFFLKILQKHCTDV